MNGLISARALWVDGMTPAALIMGLILTMTAGGVSATPMSQADRRGFIAGASQSCFQGQRKGDPEHKLTDDQLKGYCACIAFRSADMISSEDLQEYTMTRDDSILAEKRKAATDYCSTTLQQGLKSEKSKVAEKAPGGKEKTESPKQLYVREYIGNCRHGQLSEDANDPIVDKLVSAASQRKLCACQANKSFELIGLDKLRTSIANKDPSLIKSELLEAKSFCMTEMREKEQIALAIATECMADRQRTEGGNAAKDAAALCICQGKRVGQKSNSWKNLESMLQDNKKDLLKESRDYCGKSGGKPKTAG